jgi:hypothetical protein
MRVTRAAASLAVTGRVLDQDEAAKLKGLETAHGAITRGVERRKRA